MNTKGPRKDRKVSCMVEPGSWVVTSKQAFGLHSEVLLVAAGCGEHLNQAQVMYNLFNSSNHLLSNQADHPQGIRCARVLRISEYILLDPDLLGLDIHAFPYFCCAAVGLGDSTEVKRGDTGQVAQHILPVPLFFLYGVPMEGQAPETREDS